VINQTRRLIDACNGRSYIAPRIIRHNWHWEGVLYVRISAIWMAIAALLCTSHTFGQAQAPSEVFEIAAPTARAWKSGSAEVIQLSGALTISTDEAKLSAQSAVIWLMPSLAGLADEQEAQIALLGEARVEQGGVVRTGTRMFVTQLVRGSPRIRAADFQPQDLSDSDVYRQALTLRPAPATTQPAAREHGSPVLCSADDMRSIMAADGKVAYVLSGHVLLTQNRRRQPSTQPAMPAAQPDSSLAEHLELRAERAVVFTQLTSMRDLTNAAQFHEIEDAVYAAYLEGDVRIEMTPGDTAKPSQSLAADRVYYEFATDRAILTEAVIHSFEPQHQIPIIVRAETIRQLSLGEYHAEHTVLTTSGFAVPSYAINARTAYVRETSLGGGYGNQTTFSAHDVTLSLFQVPVFYLPVAAGSMTERGGALRGFEVGSGNDRGLFAKSEWGLFETLGKQSPTDLDMTYRVDGYTERGPALGLNAAYAGGFITETTRQPWDFQGEFKSYFLINDTGVDNLGGDRRTVDPSESLRGHVLWEHQQFFSQDWQAQLRAGYVTDATYLPRWERGTFNNGLAHDVSIYLKHQHETEAYSVLAEFQPNNIVTTANQLNNSFPDPATSGVQNSDPYSVERLPELSYHRIGDDLLDDRVTFFSDNLLSSLQFQRSHASLFDFGFQNARGNPHRDAVLPGLPAIGTTGITNDRIFRADLRQEVDWPITAGQFKVVPFLLGRYTGYTDSPDANEVNRVLLGAGVRITTAFWKVDDSAKSDLFDIHRLRHVVEPEVQLFTSTATADDSDVFIYDPQIDAIHDVSAAQLGIRQRWQTKRGGPGNWRSVDFLTLNVEANFFANQPSPSQLPPDGFRGLYLMSVPEESLPRNSVNVDGLWRISDTTVLLADLQHNLDQQELATTSIGLAVRRDTHLSYFLGLRYIGQVNSTIASLATNYQLSTRYSVLFGQSYSLSEKRSQETTATVVRRFDRFFVAVNIFYDEIANDSGFSVGIYPEGLGYTTSTDQLQRIFGQ
jgi:hypothetical protein